MAVGVQGIEFTLNSFEQVILNVRFGLTDFTIIQKQNTVTTAGPEERDFHRNRRLRQLQEQIYEAITGAEERDYCRNRNTRLLQEQVNETTARAEGRGFCRNKRTRLLQEQK